MGTVTEALNDALAAVQLKPGDAAAVALARAYAAELDVKTCPECDRGGDLAKVGPLLLAVLTALGMTPAARKAVTGKGGTDASSGPSPMDELRQRRANRKRAASAVDAATP